MSQEQFVEKTAKITNILLGAGAIASVLVLLVLIYRHGSTVRFLYVFVPLVSASCFFFSLRLNSFYKVNVVLVGLSLTLCGYGAEAYLYFSNPMPYELRKPITAIDGAPEWKKQRAKEFAKQFGVDFDIRDTLEVVTDLRNQGVDAVPFISPSNNLFDRAPDGSVRMAVKVGGVDIVPLGGIANKITVLCNESGEYVTYPSDRYGFNNPASTAQLNSIEIAAVGDSFAQGYCVPPDRNFVALIRNRYPATLNLGIAGDGPLLMLATLKDYLSPLKPKIVLWFYFEGNDLQNLVEEKKLNLLRRYLEGRFVQNLRERQSEIDQALIDYVNQRQSKHRQNRGENRPYFHHLMEFIKLSALRERSGLISADDSERLEAVSEANLALFRDVLSQAKGTTAAWGGEVYFVYLPAWDRYAQDADIYGHERAKVLDDVKNLGIPLIDVHPAFQAQEDPLSLFPFREPNHYNANGHKIVADEVLKALGSADAAVGSQAGASIGAGQSAVAARRDR